MPESEARVAGRGGETENGVCAIKLWTQKFITQLRAQRNFSLHTIRAYTSDLNEFSEFSQKQGVSQPSGIDRHHIRALIAHWQSGKLNRNSLLRKISCVRSFCRFLRALEALKIDPFVNVPRPKKQNRLPRVLSSSEVGSLLAAEPKRGKIPERDRAILELLYSCGLRRDELCRLNFDDIDFVGGFVRVFGKRSRERMVPAGTAALKSLRAYLSVRKEGKASGDMWERPLFLNHRGARLTGAGIALIVRKWAKAAGFLKPVNPHLFRHSFATHLIDGGCDLREVQEMLGHKSLATTQVYTHLSLEHLKKVYEKSHPRGKS